MNNYSEIKEHAVKAVMYMKRDASGVNNILNEYIKLYEDFILSLEQGGELEIRNNFRKIKSLSRAYLEASSVWDKKFLGEMNAVEKLGQKFIV